MKLELTREQVLNLASQSTSALARDWIKMVEAENVTCDVKMEREVVEKIVQLTETYVSICDWREADGGGMEHAATVIYDSLKALSAEHRRDLASDWLQLHEALGHKQ